MPASGQAGAVSLQVDTFNLQSAVTDLVLVRHLADSLALDSTTIARYRINFMNSKGLQKEFALAIPYYLERGFWSVSNEVFVDSMAGIDRRFVILTNGFEACGYPQNSLLFFADDRVELVDQWVSYSDGGLGVWRELFAVFNGNQVIEFRHRTVSSEAIESPGHEALIEVTYRDSAIVKEKGKKWIGEAVTLPNVRYRTDILTTDEYYQ